MTSLYPAHPLAAVCAKITDGTHYTPPAASSGRAFLTVKNITDDGGLDFSNCIQISETEFARASGGDSVPRVGDVLFSKDGTVGKVHLVDEKIPFAVLSSIAIMRPDRTKVLPEYLAVCLRKPDIIATATGRKTGSAIRRIILRDLSKVEIPLPPMHEQRRIVDILNRANGFVRLRREALDKARQLVPALFVNMFGDPATNPKGWEEVPFGEVITYSKYGPRFPNRPYSPDGPRILRTTDMLPDGNLRISRSPRISASDDELSKHALRPRTLLITRSGTIGRLALFRGHAESCIAGAYLIEFGLRDTINEDYVLSFLLTGHGQNCLLRGSRSMTLANLNAPTIKKIRMPLPPVSQQNAFAKRVADIQATIAQQERMAEAGEQLVASLVAQLFDGARSKPSALAAPA